MKANDEFIRLVNAMAITHDRDNVPPTMAVDGMAEIDDAIDMLGINFDEEDGPEVMLQNLASLVGAAFRMATVLMKDIPPEKMAQIIEENRP